MVNFKRKNNCDFVLTRIYINNTYIHNNAIKNTALDKRLYFDVFPLDNVVNAPDMLVKYESRILRKKRLIKLIDPRDYESTRNKFFAKKIISFFLRPFRGQILLSLDNLIRKYYNCDTEYVCSMCSQYLFDKQVMLKSVYGEPTLHKFEDVELYIPENIDSYLKTLFGSDYMQIPPENKRRKGFDIYKTDED